MNSDQTDFDFSGPASEEQPSASSKSALIKTPEQAYTQMHALCKEMESMIPEHASMKIHMHLDQLISALEKAMKEEMTP